MSIVFYFAVKGGVSGASQLAFFCHATCDICRLVAAGSGFAAFRNSFASLTLSAQSGGILSMVKGSDDTPQDKFPRYLRGSYLREARVRHGRGARIGYTWAIIEPVLLISILTFLFTQVGTGVGSGRKFSAVLCDRGAGIFDVSQHLDLYQHGVRPEPTVVQLPDGQTHRHLHRAPCAGWCDQLSGNDIGLVVSRSWHWMHSRPNDIPRMLLAFGFAAGNGIWRGRQLGRCGAAFMPTISNVYMVIMGPAFFVSGVFFSLADLPTLYREIVAWNPLIHGIEEFRAGYYPEYPDADIDLFYLTIWVVVLNFIGLVGEWLTRFRQV